MLFQFQVHSKVIWLYIYMYLFFFRFFSHLGCYIILTRVPCAIQQVLVDESLINYHKVLESLTHSPVKSQTPFPNLLNLSPLLKIQLDLLSQPFWPATHRIDKLIPNLSDYLTWGWYGLNLIEGNKNRYQNQFLIQKTRIDEENKTQMCKYWSY